MGLVAFVVEQVGAEAGGALLRTEEGAGPNEYSRAVEDLAGRSALDDPGTVTLIAGHFAEVALSKYLAREEEAAGQAASALLQVMKEPFVLVKASRFQSDIEIVSMTRIDARTEEEAEAVFEATIERMLQHKPGM